ncbi:MAG: hypothetical protein RIM33_07395 [Alphaproteobacteria bacterium]
MATGTGETRPESYEGTIKTLIHTKRGAYDKLDYLPVFRASGVFYAIVDETRTTVVTFMNYWLMKNDNPSVGTMVTLRDQAGKKVARTFFELDKTVYQVDARELLDLSGDAAGDRFEGTMELEFHSQQDLKFAFPALLVYYMDETGASCVHTNQRTFNNREDLERGSRFNRWQTGFDIHCRDGARPFVFLINGEKPAGETQARLTLFNRAGDRMDRDVDLGALPAYGARQLDLSSVPGLADFLGDDVGFAKADVDLADIYCRFACGVEQKDGFVGVTHSYFDCNQTEDYYDIAEFDSDTYPCFVPVNLVAGVDVDVVLYPIQSPAELTFSVQAFNDDGSVRATIDYPDTFVTNSGRMFRLDPKAFLKSAGVDADDEMVCIQIASKSGKIPARITFGLNYHIGEKPGCNISSSVLMASSHGAKSRSWLWGAAVHQPGGRNLALISHMPKAKSDHSAPEFTFELYNRDGLVASTGGRIRAGTGLNIEIEQVLADAGYTPGNREFLWYVVKSDNPSLIANQIHISAQGRIGGDHSF